MKKLLSLLLAMVIALCCMAPALAETAEVPAEKAAVTIDRSIGKAEPQETPQAPPPKTMTEFQLNQ